MQENRADSALLVLRVVLAIIFIAHGVDKFMNLAGTTGFFTSLGIPMPAIAVPALATVETVAGLGLLIGIGTRIFTLLLMIDMLVAIATFKLSKGLLNGYELELMILGGLVALAIVGAGRFALMRGKMDVAIPARLGGSTG